MVSRFFGIRNLLGSWSPQLENENRTVGLHSGDFDCSLSLRGCVRLPITPHQKIWPRTDVRQSITVLFVLFWSIVFSF